MRRLGCILACLALAACAGTPRELRIGVGAGPVTIVPNRLNEEFTLSVMSNVYETLVDLDARLALRPGLAESWHSPDERTWVFRLRPGVRLHDGRVLSAEDVKGSLEDARDHRESRRRVQLAALKGIEVRDERTLVLTTAAAFDPLPVRLGNVHIWAPGKDGAAIGSGPYRVREWKQGGDVRLERFDAYRLGGARIPEIHFRAIPEAAERAQALRARDLDLAIDVPAEEMRALDAAAGLRAVSENGLRVLLLGMDTRRVFKDVRVRRAVALAIDRQALVAGPLGGYGDVVDEIVSPLELGGHERSLPARRPHDPEAARRLLAEAGLGGGFDVSLEYMPTKYRAMDAVTRAIASDLARVGIRVEPRGLDPGSMLSRVERQQTTFYVLGWISDTGDGRVSYEYLLHTPNGSLGLDNGGDYSNPEVDALIERVSGRLTAVERQQALARLAQIVYDEVPVLPLYRQADLYGVRDGLVFEPRLDRRMRVFEMAWERP